MIKLSAPLEGDELSYLQAGDEVLIQGYIYGARDAAHKKMIESFKAGYGWPFDIKGQIIFYVGPCPAPPGRPVGSAGPTTSGRMDSYTPILLEQGLKAMIGKGDRSPAVAESICKNQAIYLVAIGGAAAYLSNTIKAFEVIAYPELGPEAIIKMTVEDFPCIVAIDSRGGNVYEKIRK